LEKTLLFKYFSRQASEEERREVRKWVEESPEHMEEFMQERRFFDATILLSDESEIEATPVKRNNKLIYTLSRIAAVVLITLGLSYLYNHVVNPVNIPMQTLTVPAGQQLNLTLSDGTNVWLNSQTKISYPAVFTGNDRRVSIDGEAYFKVSHDASKPFKVETCKGVVEVLGTTFNVEAYKNEDKFNVALLEGSVKIESNGDDYLLAPDQMASLNKDGTMHITQISDYNAYRWIDGIISLKNDRFELIMKKFEKYYGIKISIENKGVNENITYTGKFYQADGVQYALRVLQRDIRFTYDYDEENHIIHIK